MKNLVVSAIALTVVLATGESCEAGLNVFQGGACAPIGKIHTNTNGDRYSCIKNVDTGNGFWRLEK